MSKELDFEKNHFCPVYGREIDTDLCYESLLCLSKCFKVESVSELKEVSDIEKARILCSECPYSDI